MSFTFAAHSYPSYREFIAHRAANPMRGSDGAPVFAYPVDAWILRTLASIPVRAVLDKAIDAYVGFQFGQTIAAGITVDQKSFPDLFETVYYCAGVLGIPVPHAIAHQNGPLFNAYTSGTDENAFISISTGLYKFFTPEEVRFVVGHECGHICAGHMAYHTAVQLLTGSLTPYLGPLGQILRVTAGVPLMAWSRRSEITADRAGLLCCRDIRVAERALLKLVAGLAGLDAVDVDSYLQRARTMNDYHSASKLNAWFASHPQIPKRIEAIRIYARSAQFCQLTDVTPKDPKRLLSDVEMNRQVSEIIKP